MAASNARTSPAPDPNREIVISRVFDAPRETVWNAWTDPKQVAQWWGPRGFTTTIHEMDVRPGGVWRHTMHGPDGANYPNRHVFLEVVKPERIVYSHTGGREGSVSADFQTTWTFEEEEDNKTRVTVCMVFDSQADRDRTEKEYAAVEGGTQTLACLADQLAKTPIVIERSLNAPMDTVWQALTDVKHMKQWYFPQITAFKPEVGFETRVDVSYNDRTYPHLWKVTEVVPGRKITYSWKYAGDPGESFLTFELFPEGNKTKVRLTHAGLETFLPESHPQYARGNFLKGWTHFTGSLQQYVERTH
jgi:uncharacterized protein YndB with AHSA1/START domain